METPLRQSQRAQCLDSTRSLVEDWEKETILDFYQAHPDDGYRRVTYMLMDADRVAVSPSTVDRVLSQAGVLGRGTVKPSSKCQGFVQPLAAREHWHTDMKWILSASPKFHVGYFRYLDFCRLIEPFFDTWGYTTISVQLTQPAYIPLKNFDRKIHEEVLKVLPWYVNGTLMPPEQTRVESHINGCLKCRGELVQLQQISIAVRDTDFVTFESNSSFQTLRERIHNVTSRDIGEEKLAKTNREPRKFTLLAGRNTFKYLVYVNAAMILLGVGILLVLSGFWIDSELPLNDFRTLSSSSKNLTGDVQIRVVFADHVRTPRINRILVSMDGEIVSGPTAYGVYTIRLRNQIRDAKNLSRLLEEVRANDLIIFAEPARFSLSDKQSG